MTERQESIQQQLAVDAAKTRTNCEHILAAVKEIKNNNIRQWEAISANKTAIGDNRVKIGRQNARWGMLSAGISAGIAGFIAWFTRR